ncbi:MAG: TPR repeat protein [Parasphingorhabdus sp.]|jgi:TPR repeat protein
MKLVNVEGRVRIGIVFAWMWLSGSANSYAAETIGEIYGSQDDVVYFDLISAIDLKSGSKVTIIWDLDGSLIEVGTAEVTAVDNEVVTARMLDGQASIGMFVQLSGTEKNTTAIVKTDENQNEEDTFDLDQTLNTCNQYLRNDRLTISKQGNALNCYESILAIDSKNTAALNGIRAIQARYVILIESALSENNQQRANQLLNRLTVLNPENTEIAILRQSILRLTKQQPVAVSTPAIAKTDAIVQKEHGTPSENPDEFVPVKSVSIEPSPKQTEIVVPELITEMQIEATEEKLVLEAAVLPEQDVKDWNSQNLIKKSKAISNFGRAFSFEKTKTAKGIQRAYRLYSRAAHMGYAKAQFKLGWFLENGIGIDTDPVKALDWYLKAESQDDKNAQLGVHRLKSLMKIN